MLTVITYSRTIPSTAAQLSDIKSIVYNTNAQGGFIDATIELNREPGKFYNDIGFNYMIQISTDDGTVVWEGRIANIPQPINGNGFSYTLNCVGFVEFLSFRTSLLKPNYASATDIALMIRAFIDSVDSAGTYLLINYNTNTIPLTGRSIIYQPGNYGSALSHMTELLKYGDSNNNLLTYQVWNNRVIYILPRPSLSSPDYEISISNCDSASIGISSDNFYTRVTVAYRGAFDTMYISVGLGDAIVSSMTNYSTIFGTTFGSASSAATTTPFIREPEIIDITSHGVITASQAQAVAISLLKAYSGNGVRLSSSSLTISNQNAINYKQSGMPVELSKIRAGKVIAIKDLAGTDMTYNQEQSSMYIVQTSVTYNESGLSITLTGETQPSTDVMLGAMLSSIPVIPLSGSN